MKKITLCLALASLLALGGPALAEVGTIDDVPAATLLLPYFECELGPNLVPAAGGITTLFSINNASAVAQLAHVTLWTDESIPTLDFDVYLTGYDVQTINICDIFSGNLPRTASLGQDPSDTISPAPPPGNVYGGAMDINFVSCSGFLPYNNPALSSTLLNHIRNAHTGGPSTVFSGRCSGFDYGDTIARGYITVDNVTQCSLEFPSSPAYYSGIIGFNNVLWGDYFYVNSAENFAQGETLVHVEACNPIAPFYRGFVGTGTSGVNTCPMGAGDYTFYGRYVSGLGTDQREALSTTFATRYLNGGAFTGGTSLYVWRDSKTVPGAPGGPNGPFTCGGNATWFPLGQADVVAFNEQEDSTNLCFQGDNISPAIGGADTCFPLEAQCVSLQGGNIPGDNPTPPYPFGWMYLNLNTTVSGGLFNPTAQAWVTTIMDASGRFSVGFDAIKLDQANQTFQSAAPGGVVILPP
jgi:hypothetical protein